MNVFEIYTIMDLIFLVYLDENTRNHLRLVPEVPLFGNHYHIFGRADWCLGHEHFVEKFVDQIE